MNMISSAGGIGIFLIGINLYRLLTTVFDDCRVSLKSSI